MYGTNPWQHVIKLGPDEREVALEAVIIQVQHLEKVVEFQKLCVPLEDPDMAVSGPPNSLGSLWQVQSSNPCKVVKLNRVPPLLQKFVFLVLT